MSLIINLIKLYLLFEAQHARRETDKRVAYVHSTMHCYSLLKCAAKIIENVLLLAIELMRLLKYEGRKGLGQAVDSS